MEPDAIEIRVVACLVEKQRTTPDVYPLSLNSLRLACNQATNRDPVVSYDEATVREALKRTALRGWTRLASGAGSRARKYRHLLDESLGLESDELSLLAVLMLRGAQTPGELKQRSARLGDFADLAAVQETLDRLVERGYVERHPRRPGQKEDRFEQMLGGGEAEAPAGASPPVDQEPAVEGGAVEAGAPGDGDETQDPAPNVLGQPAPESRLARLERELAELRAELVELRAALGD